MIVDTRWTFTAQGGGFEVACLRDEHVTSDYVAWLNDEENRRFTAGSDKVTLESQRQYVRDVGAGEGRLLLGLFSGHDGLVGTSGMHEVGRLDADTSYMGIFIGHPGYRGRGLGAVWVWVVAAILFSSFSALKVTAGCLSANTPSVKSFEKAGFVIEQRSERAEYLEGSGWTDSVLMGCVPTQLVDGDTIGVGGLGVV